MPVRHLICIRNRKPPQASLKRCPMPKKSLRLKCHNTKYDITPFLSMVVSLFLKRSYHGSPKKKTPFLFSSILSELEVSTQHPNFSHPRSSWTLRLWNLWLAQSWWYHPGLGVLHRTHGPLKTGRLPTWLSRSFLTSSTKTIWNITFLFIGSHPSSLLVALINWLLLNCF